MAHIPMRSRRLPLNAALPLAAGGLLLASSFTTASAQVRPQVAPAAAITVSSASAASVGSGFAGFSYEKDQVGADLFNPDDSGLVNLFRLLGPSVLRVGGNTADMVNWDASGKGGSDTEIAPSDVTELAAFLKATGWKVIYGINLKTNTAANAAAEAQYAARALGSSLLAFEIGNEPEFYKTESTYETSYNSFVTAITAKVPGAVFDGPGTEGGTSWMAPFAADESSNSLGILSTHEYIGDETSATVSGLLASNPGSFASDEAAMEKAATDNAIAQWRITEGNSYYDGGKAGVSNVEAAALWSLDFMEGVAAHGGAGVNFHGGISPQFPLNYTPITFSGLTPSGVQGVYYGELLWALAGTGTLHTATVSGDSSVSSWAIGQNVFVNNKGSSAVTATITLPSAGGRSPFASSADSVYILTAPSLTSTAITLANSPVSASGAFLPVPLTAQYTGNTITVSVPAGSAALVEPQQVPMP